jgi:uncharacterized membrane protein
MAENQNERLVLFSDAVIAITITLLALDIRLPGEVTELTQGELGAALLALWPRLFAYVLSFVVIANYWFTHRRKFEVITRRSLVLDWLNIVYLMTIGLIPFVTGVIAENGGAVATALYAGVAALTSIVGAVMSSYAGRTGLSSNPATLRWSSNASLLMAAVFVASIPVAFVNADVAKFCWLAIWPVSSMLRRRDERNSGAATR